MNFIRLTVARGIDEKSEWSAPQTTAYLSEDVRVLGVAKVERASATLRK